MNIFALVSASNKLYNMSRFQTFLQFLPRNDRKYGMPGFLFQTVKDVMNKLLEFNLQDVKNEQTNFGSQ